MSANALLDHIKLTAGIKNDNRLSKFLQVKSQVISKIRHNKIPFGSTLVLKVHDATEIPIKEIKAWLVAL